MLKRNTAFSLILIVLSAVVMTACSNVKQTAVSSVSSLPDPQTAIVKSPNDTRQYQSFTLPNQLEVVLVSDPSIEKSAAALSVKVGSFQEPKEFGGLAHYLEHMLFLGTKTYPEVGDYSEFVSRNGGTQNAYTQLDHTNYMVAVNNDAFDEALKRFSGFFYEATLDENYADKERNAVHSEWSMKSPNDWVILGQLDGLTLNPAHPIHQFNWGNLKSLADKGEHKLQDALVNLYDTYYSANLMKAVLISPLPLEEMQKLASRYFGLIPNKNTPEPQVTVPVAQAENLHKFVHYVPQTDMKQLRVSFVMDNNAAQFAVKPNGYVNYLLNNEMPGTLASTLRDLGLSEALYTSYDANEYGNAGSFNLYIDLTETGLQQRDTVMAAVLQYLDLLRTKGVDAKYFAEIKQSLNNSFRFKEKTNDYNYAMQIAADMQKLPTEYVLSSDYEYQRFDPVAIQQVLNQLTLENARVFYIDKSQPTDTTMENFAGQYSVDDISTEKVAQWQAMGQDITLQLPRINRLMPEDFSIVASTNTDKPLQVASDDSYSAFLGHSSYFEQPKGLVTLDLNSGVTKASARNQVMAELLNRGLSQALVELQNEAIGGGMGLSVSLFNGLSITTNGFSDKQGLLLSQAIKQVLDYQMNTNELANFKAAFKSELDSKKKGILLNQLFPKFSQIFALDEYSDETMLAAVDDITLLDIAELKAQLLQQANLRVFAFGNYSAQQINAMSQLVLNELPSDRNVAPLYESPKFKPQAGQVFNWQEETQLSDVGLVRAYLSERNADDSATAQILSQLLQPALFKQIRTEEQLAYAVGFFSQTNKDQMFTAFYIQSPAKGLAEVDARISEFRQGFKTQLAEVSEQDFATTKTSVLVSLTQPPKNLSEEMSRYIGDWREQNYAYNSRAQLISALEKVTLKDVINFYNRLEEGDGFGQLLVQMRGTQFTDKDFVSIKGAETIINIDEFHAKQLKKQQTD
ncbi:insulinase family protein [Paraglaciecola sp.]|uniref:insulinase family protein n=1 Tax=Paraglaciecola sp. TaxID=1920173 RepID=UPI00273F1B85|nr:insulinase family protein [Paraglaciecola sp.]MDP5029511.1 insulinase family protein [Paraglaciecola sp.]